MQLLSSFRLLFYSFCIISCYTNASTSDLLFSEAQTNTSPTTLLNIRAQPDNNHDHTPAKTTSMQNQNQKKTKVERAASSAQSRQFLSKNDALENLEYQVETFIKELKLRLDKTETDIKELRLLIEKTQNQPVLFAEKNQVPETSREETVPTVANFYKQLNLFETRLASLEKSKIESEKKSATVNEYVTVTSNYMVQLFKKLFDKNEQSTILRAPSDSLDSNIPFQSLKRYIEITNKKGLCARINSYIQIIGSYLAFGYTIYLMCAFLG
jgi:chromosome segregation ATPase